MQIDDVAFHFMIYWLKIRNERSFNNLLSELVQVMKQNVVGLTTDIASNTTAIITSLTWFVTSELPEKSDNNGIDISIPLYMRSFFITTGTVGSFGNLFVFSVLFKHLSTSPGMTLID